MTWLISVNPGVYEKYTSTLRAFGGKLQVTTLKEEAKRITRKRDALRRALLIVACQEEGKTRRGWCQGPAWQHVGHVWILNESASAININ